MKSPLSDLEGMTVTRVVEIHDYIQLHFGESVGISIFNRLEVSPSSISLWELVDKTIRSVVERDADIELAFRDGGGIKIDMRREAYRGPEALQLDRRGQPPVIWN